MNSKEQIRIFFYYKIDRAFTKEISFDTLNKLHEVHIN